MIVSNAKVGIAGLISAAALLAGCGGSSSGGVGETCGKVSPCGGSLVGTWLGRAVGWYQEGESAGFIMSVIGAIILLAIYHLVRRRTARTT